MPLDPNRRFTPKQRTALFLAADGQCTDCGANLEPGWHADHVTAHSRGGLTDVINGQALCPPCNLKKGNRMTGASRGWQLAALEKFTTTRSGDSFLVTATPGAGKTRFALAAARDLLDAGTISQVIVVCPTSHLRTQWAQAANEHYGIHLDSTFTNGVGALAKDFHGPVVTYQAVAQAAGLYRMLCGRKSTLVILDEIHHAGDTLSWGSAMNTAFEVAERRLLLSGTPFRSDNNPIPFVTYKAGVDGVQRSVADYTYGYGQAVNDGVVRPVVFNALDGNATWRDAGVVVQGKLDNADEEQARRALSAALKPSGSWIPSVLRTANEELTRIREAVPDAGGLVVAKNQDVARAYGEILQRITGEPTTVAISDEPEASALIRRFSDSRARWLVAVQMVSEGVDIPRLVVGVYASNITTRMFFRQVVGRFVRTRGMEDEMCASLFVPSIPPLLKHAAEIENERDHALAEMAKPAPAVDTRDRSGAGGTEQFDLFEPIDCSEPIHHSTILSGEAFADEELARAANFAQRAGMPGNVQPAQVARLLRLAGMVTAPGQRETAAASVSLVDQKAGLRKLLQTKVNRYARMAGLQYSHVHNSLNQQCGDKVATATVETLNKRLVLIDDLMRML